MKLSNWLKKLTEPEDSIQNWAPKFQEFEPVEKQFDINHNLCYVKYSNGDYMKKIKETTTENIKYTIAETNKYIIEESYDLKTDKLINQLVYSKDTCVSIGY